MNDTDQARHACRSSRTTSRRCCRIAIRSCWSTACSNSSRQERHGDQERHDQRAVLPGPFPGLPGHAGRADHRGAGAGIRPADHLHSALGAKRHRLFYLVKVDNAKFSALVAPGDQLKLDVELKRTIRRHGPVHVPRLRRRQAGRRGRTDVRASVREQMIHPPRIDRSPRQLGADVIVGAVQRHRRRRRDRRRHARSVRTS